jgi:signal transduction histidine kinase
MQFFKSHPAAPVEDSPQGIAESLYKQNHELVTKNKTLSLLRQLYQVSILALESVPLAEKIAQLVRETLEYELVSIYVVEEDAVSILPLTTSRSERFQKAAEIAALPIQSHSIKAASTRAFFLPVFNKKPNHTQNVESVWEGIIPASTIEEIIASGHLKSVCAYPLITDEMVRGVLLIGLNRAYDTLSEFELETIANVVDITALSLDRARLYEELKKANAQQIILIHFITHQLKGFVSKSRNIFSMLLEGDFGVLPDTMKPMVQEGFKSDTKGAATIQEILNAANIKSGKVAYSLKPFDMKALVEEITSDLRAGADAKGLELKLDLGDQPLEFTGDRTQLLNALKNLIDNSIKYTPSGTVEVDLHKETDKMRFEIKDTGVGITPEDMSKLFTEGGHGKESQKVNVDSTGFGLYIVKNIIEGHNGKVWAESEGAGKGSRFIVELPLTTA